MDLKRVSYHLTNLQISELKKLSQKKGLSVAELIRRAVDIHLEKEKKKEA